LKVVNMLLFAIWTFESCCWCQCDLNYFSAEAEGDSHFVAIFLPQLNISDWIFIQLRWKIMGNWAYVRLIMIKWS